MKEKLSKISKILPTLVFLAFLLGFMVYLFFFITENQGFFHEFAKTYGLVGLFIGGIISHATIFLPVPFDAVLFFVGADPQLVGIKGFPVIDILLVSIIAALGAAIGEMTAYITGLTGVSAAEIHQRKEFHHLREIRKKLTHYGMPFIFAVSLIPFPFDLIGITAGIIKFDYKKFFLATFCGKIVRYTIVLFAGHYGFEFVKGLLGF